MISRRNALKLGAAGLAGSSFDVAARSGIVRQAIALQATSGNVPVFRGNASRTGEMPGPVPDDRNGVDLLWQFDPGGRLGAPPVVVDGIAYVGSADGNLYALSLDDGVEQWRVSTGDRISSAPAIVDGVVYVGSEDQQFYALDASTGEELWRSEVGTYPGCPVAANGLILASGGDQSEMRLSALDTRDGSELWRVAHDSWTNLVPAIAGETVFFSTGSTVHALDLQSGDERWRVIAETSDEHFGIELAVAGDTVYVPRMMGVSALDTQDGSERWRTTADQFVTGSIAVADDTVFAASFQYHTVTAASARDGSRLWTYAVDGLEPDPLQPSQFGFTNVVIADGIVFASRTYNDLYALDARDGSERWTYTLHTEGGKNSLTAPVVCDEVILIGSGFESTGTLFALGGR